MREKGLTILPAVLFDFHGTLVDFPESATTALVEALGVPEAAFYAVIPGLSSKVQLLREAGSWPPPLMELWPAWYALVIEALGVDVDPVAVADRMQGLYTDPASYAAFPEVPEMLERLRVRGHRVAILSNTDVDLWPILERLGLSGLVEIAVAAFRHGVEKPSPRAFHLALDALGVAPAGTWFVGDDLRDDCVASDAFGMTAVLVDRADRHAGNPDARRFLRLPTLAPLPDLIA